MMVLKACRCCKKMSRAVQKVKTNLDTPVKFTVAQILIWVTLVQ